MYRSKFFYPCLLVLLWFVMMYIVNPFGNFPINDDWQYARPVWYLINKGYYFSPDAYSPIIISQVFLGSLFCLPGGFSFDALRISTMVLSLTGVLIFYLLLLKSTRNQKLSFLGALLLVANPFYCSLSISFMTDVPFVAFSIVSAYFFFCAIESDKQLHIILATVFAIVATLIRQFGIVIPIAFGLVSIIRNRPKFIKCWKYLLPAIITGIILESGFLWLKYIGSELKPYYGVSIIDFIKRPGNLFANAQTRGSLLLLYSGFFLLPLLLYTTWSIWFRTSKRQKIGIFVFVLIFIPGLVIWCQQFPCRNILTTYGIGPRTLKGMMELVYPNPDFPHAILLLLQIIAFIGAILLLINFGKIIIDIIHSCYHREYTKTTMQQMFTVFFFIGYAALMFVPDNFFDRYFLIFIVLSAILILSGMPENVKIRQPFYIISCIITIAMGIFSAAITHDYMAWNRTRWQGIDYLTKDLKVSPHKMDGGYEFNGWAIGVSNQASIDKGK
ncbi:MAG TPA: glycosyltransferase family 39 protein, partial [Bacteroidia bacterium]|nr:glycosyltransferase family 39 protein [Bacteroidia bacterium]